MKVPFTVSDFLYRAENVYSDRVALVDEPDTVSYTHLPLPTTA